MPRAIEHSEAQLIRCDDEVVDVLKKGASYWNRWRSERWLTNPRAERPNLYRAALCGLDLSGANLWDANFELADLSRANLGNANLKAANLSSSNLERAILRQANLADARLVNANLAAADLRGTVLHGANLSQCNLQNADLTDSYVFGISAWDVNLSGTVQRDLVITRYGEPLVTIDDLALAQFMHLLIQDANLRRVVDTLALKCVLILGRFSPERKRVLDALRNKLRDSAYLPVLFDFDRPSSRDITETVSTLAHIARFIIADITDAKSIPQELKTIVPALPSVPVQPLLLRSEQQYGMFEHFRRFPWVLKVFLYNDQDDLIKSVPSLLPAIEAKVQKQRST